MNEQIEANIRINLRSGWGYRAVIFSGTGNSYSAYPIIYNPTREQPTFIELHERSFGEALRDFRASTPNYFHCIGRGDLTRQDRSDGVILVTRKIAGDTEVMRAAMMKRLEGD